MNAPVSAFEHNGRQHIVAYSAGNLFAGSPRGDSVWLFSLDGTLEEAAMETLTAQAASLPNRMADLDNGRLLYDGACAFCHGAQGEGGHGGGTPLTASTDLAAVMRQVSEGLDIMPPFGAAFSTEEIHDVSAYVVDVLPH